MGVREGVALAISSPDVTSSEFKAKAYAFYAGLRRETPVYAAKLPDGQTGWLLTRYDDVARALKDERLFKDKRKLRKRSGFARLPGFFRSLDALERNMLDSDPPDHGRLRGLVHKGFTPRRVDEMAARVERLADELLSRIATGGPFDLLNDYALPIPSTIISEMLGIPASDQARFHRWSSDIVATSSVRSLLRTLPSLILFMRYLKRCIARKTKNPADDLISALVEAEEASDRLSADEVLAMVFLLVVAGHETTVNLIGNGTLALLEHPEERQRLLERADSIPDRGRGVSSLLRSCRSRDRALCARASRDRGRRDPEGRPGMPRARFRQPRRQPVRACRSPRRGANPEPAPRVRRRYPLLPGSAPRAARREDRSRKTFPTLAAVETRRAAGEPSVAAGAQPARPRVTAGRSPLSSLNGRFASRFVRVRASFR